MKYVIFIMMLTVSSFACQKIWPSPADEIKGNWVIDSIKTYRNVKYTETFVGKELINRAYYTFTNDGKLYTYKNETVNGVNYNIYDTFKYHVNNNFLLTQRIENNKTLMESDSLFIIIYNEKLDIFKHQPNEDGLYEKVFLHD